jgi:O-acetyl-ADP-ribose deacetylase (regulator of RNase III)
MTKLSVYKGDITKLEVDAIVNAADEALLGGGGVDGAIHSAAGPALLKECKSIGGCLAGEAKITKGYNLPARFVIHTVGPIYGHAGGRENKLLESCYVSCLKLARENGIKSIAFCAISTGAYGYPKEEAAKIAVKTVKSYTKDHPDAFEEVVFALFNQEDQAVYEENLKGDI